MKIRDRVRRWLELDKLQRDIDSARQSIRDLVLHGMVVTTEDSNCKRHEELLGAITALTQKLTEVHVPTRINQPMSYDWEQVQLQQLSDMLANQPKEEM